MRKTTFSIIVPIYRVEKYIRECIESILSQSFRDFELILVDDGSPDKCPDICDEYALSDNRIKVVHKQNGGLANARKTGADVCKGEYVINIDGDDYIADGALNIIANICEITNADVICFGIKRIGNCDQVVHNAFNEGLYNTPQSINEIYRKFIYDSDKAFFSFGLHPSLCNKAIKRELYIKYQQQTDSKVSMGEDFMVTVPVILASESIYIIDENLYFYRDNSSSMVNTYRKTEFEQLIYLVDYVKQYFSKDVNIFEPQMDAYIYNRLNNIFTCECIIQKSMFAAMSTLNTYYKQIKEHISGKKSKPAGLKYTIIKFAIEKRMWIYFILNAQRIKIKNKRNTN